MDEAIIRHDSFRGIARRYCVSPDAIERHAKTHLPGALVKSARAAEVLNADRLIEQMSDLQRRTLALLEDAEKDGDGRLRAVAIAQARENVAAIGKLVSELNASEQKQEETRYRPASAEPLDIEAWNAKVRAYRLSREGNEKPQDGQSPVGPNGEPPRTGGTS